MQDLDGRWRVRNADTALRHRLNSGASIGPEMLSVRLASRRGGQSTEGGRKIGELDFGPAGPFDPKLFGKAANNGQMVFEVNPKAKAAEGLSLFAQQLSRRDAVAPAAKPVSLFDKLLKRG